VKKKKKEAVGGDGQEEKIKMENVNRKGSRGVCFG
jgi:hypothetical protein